MRTIIAFALLSMLLNAGRIGLAWDDVQNRSGDPARLDQRIRRFDITDGTLVDGMAIVSTQSVDGLHLGVEDILREKFSDPADRSVRFSLHVENRSVREILELLCERDSRFTWSAEGSSINIYPRATIGEVTYLLNRQLEEIELTNIPDADQALTPLARKLPEEQLGYMQAAGDVTYSKPLTAHFKNLSVRQLINRVAEHLGPRSSWVFQGSRDSRMFTFEKGGFRTDASNNAQ